MRGNWVKLTKQPDGVGCLLSGQGLDPSNFDCYAKH